MNNKSEINIIDVIFIFIILVCCLIGYSMVDYNSKISVCEGLNKENCEYKQCLYDKAGTITDREILVDCYIIESMKTKSLT